MNAVIYVRVSTKEQVDEGNSLAVQEKQCRAFANQKDGYNVTKVFVEEGESAKTANRTQLQILLKYCTLNKDKIDAILVARLDRLSRDRMDYGQLKAFFGALGIKVISIAERFEDDPVGRFIENTLAGVAQLDNEIRAERSKGGMVEGVRQGRWMWKAPFGFVNTRVEGKKNIAPKSELMSSLLNEAWLMIDSGHTEQETRLKLAQRGLVDDDGKAMAKQTFSSMFRKRIYKGVIDKFDLVIYSESIKPIVEPELWDRVYKRLEGNNKKPSRYTKLRPEFPLRGVLYCKDGHRMTASSPRGNGGVYPKYHCATCRGNGASYDSEQMHVEFKDYLSTFEYTPDISNALRTAIELVIEQRHSTSKKTVIKLKRRITELENLEFAASEKHLKGIYNEDHALRIIKKYQSEADEVHDQLAEVEMSVPEVEKILDEGLETLENLGSVWARLQDVYVKDRFQKWLFPVGVSYDGQLFGTSQLPLCVSIKKDLSAEKSLLVIPRRIELRLPE